jgi:hypothetical protein
MVAARFLLPRLFLVLPFVWPPPSGSPSSDFQARAAQTQWNLLMCEGIIRSLPPSAAAVPTPEGLSSYLALLSENVAALTTTPMSRLTDEQRKTFVAGFRAIAMTLKDLSSLAGNRGLSSAASTLTVFEASCRSSIDSQ